MTVQNQYCYGVALENPPTQAPDSTWTPMSVNLFGGTFVTPHSPDTGNPELFAQPTNSQLNQFISLDAPTRSLPVVASYLYGFAFDTSSLQPPVVELNTDAIPRDADFYQLRVSSYGYLFDGTNFNSARQLASNADAQVAAQIGLAGTVSRLQGFNGATFDRLRTASAAVQGAESGVGILAIAAIGNWAITHTPAVNVKATITRAAGAAGVRHVATSITATCSVNAATVAADVVVQVNLRDGATGAGAILWSATFVASAISGVVVNPIITISGLSIVGTAATAMTLEFSAANTVLIESVSLTGYDTQ